MPLLSQLRIKDDLMPESQEGYVKISLVRLLIYRRLMRAQFIDYLVSISFEVFHELQGSIFYIIH